MALLNAIASVGYYQGNILNSFFNKKLVGVARKWFNQSSTWPWKKEDPSLVPQTQAIKHHGSYICNPNVVKVEKGRSLGIGHPLLPSWWVPNHDRPCFKGGRQCF